MDRGAIARAGVVALAGLLVLAGAAAIYYYTAAPPTRQTTTESSSSGISSVVSSSSTTVTNATQPGPSGGDCVRNPAGQCVVPRGVWADYLGYIPPGYTLAPHYPNAPVYPCPSGVSGAACAVFQQSCGNGVCDPNESCATCPIDCGVSGIGVPPLIMACDPYTGRPGQPWATPATVCQITNEG